MAALVSEPIRTARVGAAWAGNREHHLLSRVPECNGLAVGARRSYFVVHCLLLASPILLRDICPTDVRLVVRFWDLM